MLIHQESIIAAAPRAVYEVLTDGQKFAAATGMPAQLSDLVGEAFSLFGGRSEKWENAADLYTQAANAFRVQKQSRPLPSSSTTS